MQSGTLSDLPRISWDLKYTCALKSSVVRSLYKSKFQGKAYSEENWIPNKGRTDKQQVVKAYLERPTIETLYSNVVLPLF